MQMKDVYDLLTRFEQSNLSELSLEMEGVSFHGKKGGSMTVTDNVVSAQTAGSELHLQKCAESTEKANADMREDSSSTEGYVAVTAQIAGTFYRAPSPDEEPFVKVGQTVKKGETLGLMEAMKMMSNVVAPADGTIKEIPVENATLVSFGAPLFYIG